MSDVAEAGRDADVLVFVVPHQFVKRICEQLKDTIKPTAIAISLIKVRFSVCIDIGTYRLILTISDIASFLVKKKLLILCDSLAGYINASMEVSTMALSKYEYRYIICFDQNTNTI